MVEQLCKYTKKTLTELYTLKEIIISYWIISQSKKKKRWIFTSEIKASTLLVISCSLAGSLRWKPTTMWWVVLLERPHGNNNQQTTSNKECRPSVQQQLKYSNPGVKTEWEIGNRPSPVQPSSAMAAPRLKPQRDAELCLDSSSTEMAMWQRWVVVSHK